MCEVGVAMAVFYPADVVDGDQLVDAAFALYRISNHRDLAVVGSCEQRAWMVRARRLFGTSIGMETMYQRHIWFFLGWALVMPWCVVGINK